MKFLSLLLMAVLAIMLFACQKENIESPVAEKKEQPAPHNINYFSLPPGGEYVNFQFVNGKKLSLYKSDTMYLLEGDIALTPTQVDQLKLINNGNARTYLTDLAKHWFGVIPYTFNANLTTASRNTILNAINDWSSLVSGLVFVARTNEPNYIEFNATSNVNNSPLGKTGGKQTINLAQDPSWGVDLTSATHEIGHSLGMFHEQSRTDRGNFITINWANIRDNMEHNFQTYTASGIPGAQLGTFDFNSIMLYPSFISDPNFVFDANTPVMTTLNGGTWGFNFWLSAGDVETGAYIYGPPFCRLRYVTTYENMQFGYEEVIRDVFIDFFADPQLTQPVNLNITRPIRYQRITYNYTASGGPWYTYNDYAINLTAGSQSYYLGESTFYLTYDGSGTTTDEQQITYVLREPFGRW